MLLYSGIGSKSTTSWCSVIHFLIVFCVQFCMICFTWETGVQLTSVWIIANNVLTPTTKFQFNSIDCNVISLIIVSRQGIRLLITDKS